MKVTNGDVKSFAARAYNGDSYVLISAGPDALYGTSDDICNFERK